MKINVRLLIITFIVCLPGSSFHLKDQKCETNHCTSCSKAPKICDECEDFFFLDEQKNCQNCASGCVTCKNEKICLECTSTKTLSSSQECRLKSWIWIAIIGSIIFLILVGGILLFIFDRKAAKKQIELKKKLLEHKKKLLERKKQEIEKEKAEKKNNKPFRYSSESSDSFRAYSTSIGSPVKEERTSYNGSMKSSRDGSIGGTFERKSRVKLHGGKLSQYLTKIRLEKKMSLNSIRSPDYKESQRKTNSTNVLAMVGDKNLISEEDEYGLD